LQLLRRPDGRRRETVGGAEKGDGGVLVSGGLLDAHRDGRSCCV